MTIIDRTCEPTKYDIYPQYTIMKVGPGPDEYGGVVAPNFFIQLSPDDSMSWKPISILFDTLAYKDGLYDKEEIIQEFFKLITDQSRPYTHLAELLCNIKRS